MTFCIDLPNAAVIAGNWLFDWQTLIAGTIAVIGAVFTVRKIAEQISQAERHRTDEIERRHSAARVALPLVLSEVGDLTQRMADNIAKEIQNYHPETGQRVIDAILEDQGGVVALPPVSLSSDVIDGFQRFAETLNEREEVRHIAELLGSVQILLSRYQGFNFGQAGVILSLYGLMLDAAKVRLLNDSLYNYARFVDERSFALVGAEGHLQIWDDILGKAQGLLFHQENPDAFFGELQKKIDRYKQANTSPWLERFDV